MSGTFLYYKREPYASVQGLLISLILTVAHLVPPEGRVCPHWGNNQKVFYANMPPSPISLPANIYIVGEQK